MQGASTAEVPVAPSAARAAAERPIHAGYREAARLTTSLPEQRYLLARAARLAAAEEAMRDTS